MRCFQHINGGSAKGEVPYGCGAEPTHIVKEPVSVEPEYCFTCEAHIEDAKYLLVDDGEPTVTKLPACNYIQREVVPGLPSSYQGEPYFVCGSLAAVRVKGDPRHGGDGWFCNFHAVEAAAGNEFSARIHYLPLVEGDPACKELVAAVCKEVFETHE